MESARAVALPGPRQTGKSTPRRRSPAAGRQPTISRSDDDPVRFAARADPQGFVAAFGRRTVIDEAQRAPDLLLAVNSPACERGLVVYAGQRTLPSGDCLWALPLSGLWRP